MALSNYDDLKASVAQWLNRTDLTDQIPDFITLAESRLNRVLRLRVMETEASLSIAANGQSVALPEAFVEPLGLWAVESYGRRALRYLDPSQVEDETAGGEAHFWTITGANIELDRPTDVALAMVLRFVQAFALSSDTPTNWLLTNHPDIYLFSALVEAAPYIRDNDLLGVWQSRLGLALAEVQEKEARSRSRTTLDTGIPLLPSWTRYNGRGGYGTHG